MSFAVIFAAFVASLMTTNGKAKFLEFVENLRTYLRTGNVVAFKKIRAYKHLRVIQPLLDPVIQLTGLFVKMTESAAITRINPRRTLKVTYKGQEHIIGIVKATDVGLPKRIAGEAICRPMEDISFVIMSDDLFDNEFVVMHEVGHTVQRMVLTDKCKGDASAIMNALNSFGMIFCGFPLEPQADAFAMKYAGCGALGYAKAMKGLFGIVAQDLTGPQMPAVAMLMAGRYLGGLVAPVIEAELEEIDNTEMVLSRVDMYASEEAIKQAKKLMDASDRLGEIRDFLSFGKFATMFSDVWQSGKGKYKTVKLDD